MRNTHSRRPGIDIYLETLGVWVQHPVLGVGYRSLEFVTERDATFPGKRHKCGSF
jgi:hypothetical protein